MAGTSSSISRKAAASGLPVPQVRLTDSPDALVMHPDAGGTDLFWQNQLTIVAIDIPASLLAPAVDLQVELLHYVGARTSRTRQHPVNGGTSAQTHAGWHRPAGKTAGVAIPSNSDTRGGSSQNVDVDRIVSHTVTSRNQVIKFNLGSYFRVRDVIARTTTGNAIVMYPTHCASTRGVGRYTSGRRFPWSQKVRPGYFAFRYHISAQDSTHPGERIAGPWSKTLAVTTRHAPFLHDQAGTAAMNDGTFYGLANPGFLFDQMRIDWSAKQMHSN